MNDLARALLILVSLGILHSHAAPQVIPLSATLNGRAAGEVNAAIDNDRLNGMDIGPIRPQLEELLPPEEYQKLQTRDGEMISPELLEAAGVHTHFDLQSLTIDMNIPIEKRRVQKLSLLAIRVLPRRGRLSPPIFPRI